MTLYADRSDAGLALAADLEEWRGTDAVVLGIPRGGVVVAAAVATRLGLPLGVVITRKLGAPGQAEFAIGAIGDGVRVVNPDAIRLAEVTPEQLAFIEDVERVELTRRERRFAGSGPDLAGRAAIIVDDGVATGATAMAACHVARAHGAARIVLAVPVAPAGWRPDRRLVDEYVCASPEEEFWAVGQFYADFTQASDDDVARLLEPGDVT